MNPNPIKEEVRRIEASPEVRAFMRANQLRSARSRWGKMTPAQRRRWGKKMQKRRAIQEQASSKHTRPAPAL